VRVGYGNGFRWKGLRRRGSGGGRVLGGRDTYRGEREWEEEDADKGEKLDILTKSRGRSAFDDRTRVEQLM